MIIYGAPAVSVGHLFYPRFPWPGPIRGSPWFATYPSLHEPPHFTCQTLNQQYWSHTLRQEMVSAPFFLASVSFRSVCFLLLAVFGCSRRLHPPSSESCHVGPLSLHRPLFAHGPGLACGGSHVQEAETDHTTSKSRAGEWLWKFGSP